MPHRPVALPGTAAQVDVLVVEEEVRVEPAQLIEQLAAHQQRAAGRPRDFLAPCWGEKVAFAPGAGQQQPRESAQQGRERAGRRLATAVVVAHAQADDAGPWFVAVEPVCQRSHAVEEVLADRHVGIEQQNPVAATETHSFVDGTSETTIASPAP